MYSVGARKYELDHLFYNERCRAQGNSGSRGALYTEINLSYNFWSLEGIVTDPSNISNIKFVYGDRGRWSFSSLHA